MALSKYLLPRLILMLQCYLIFAFCFLLSLLHLPIHIYKRSKMGTAPTAPPKVHITTHEPSTTTAKDTILFIHGFPDSAAMFDAQITRLCAEGYRCLAVDLPAARGEPVDIPLAPDDTAQLVYDELAAIHDGPVTVVGHDWGSFYAMLLVRKHPEAVRRIVHLDVGNFGKQETSALMAIFGYQMLLAFLYWVGEPVGTLGLKAFLLLARYDVRPMKEITVDMCYPYLGFMKQIVKAGGLNNAKWKDWDKKEAVRKIPHYYVYGKKKIFMFHDEGWVKYVEKTPHGEVAALPTGHWLTMEKPEECSMALLRWFEKTEKAGHGGAESEKPAEAIGED